MPSTSAVPSRTRIAIVGSGFAGLGMAIKLRERGIDDFVLLDRGSEVGGTWRDNTYPGAACDVPSHLYSFSFAPNPDWTHSFSGQPEIQAYLQRCADESGVRRNFYGGCEVTAARWDDARAVWHVETSCGDLDAKLLVSAVGALSEPRVPPIPGIEDFPGRVFHSASWDHSFDLSGKRVAVVGTGASSIQFVPQIAPKVAELHLFQRTAPWVIPRLDRAFSRTEKWLFEHVPAVQRLIRSAIYWGREAYVLGFAVNPRIMRLAERAARGHLQRQVPDPELRRKLTPDYTIGCKRILIASDYYPALARPNVEVLTEGLVGVRGSTVVGSDGSERDVDAIVFGTGFHVTDMPAAQWLYGRGGVQLANAWSDGMAAYRGTTVAGFPNLFMLVGPNTGLGHTSMVVMIEAQIAYVLDCLRHMDACGVGVVDVRPDAEASYNERLQQDMRGTVWTAGGCASWYLDDRGRNTTLWPSFTFRFRRQTEAFDPGAYDVEPVAEGHERPTEPAGAGR